MHRWENRAFLVGRRAVAGESPRRPPCPARPRETKATAMAWMKALAAPPNPPQPHRPPLQERASPWLHDPLPTGLLSQPHPCGGFPVWRHQCTSAGTCPREDLHSPPAPRSLHPSKPSPCPGAEFHSSPRPLGPGCQAP